MLDLPEADGSAETIRTTDEHPFWVKGFGSFQGRDPATVGQELPTSASRLTSPLAFRGK